MGEKPVQRADRAAARRGPAADAAARRWWRFLPAVLTAPRTAFAALRDDDEIDVAARQEPILAIVLLAGMAGAVLTPTWGRLLDDEIGATVAVVLTFIGGSTAGAVVYFLLGIALWAGIRGAGSLEPMRLARQVAGFAALPIALSLFVTAPLALIAFGGDYFRSGGSDDGVGHAIVVALGLAFVAWSIGLLALGLRTALGLTWRGVVTAMALAAVALGALAALPYAF